MIKPGKITAALVASALIAGTLGGCGDKNESDTGNADLSGTASSFTVSETSSSAAESTVSSAEASEPVTSKDTASSEESSVPEEPAVSEPVEVVDPNENQVSAQHEPIVIQSSSSSKPVVSKPTNPDKAEIIGDGHTASSTPASSSTPTQRAPDDTTGVALDSKGCPADIGAWIKNTGSTKFVDSAGQLWVVDPGLGWKKPSAGGVTDQSSIDPSKGQVVGH